MKRYDSPPRLRSLPMVAAAEVMGVLPVSAMAGLRRKVQEPSSGSESRAMTIRAIFHINTQGLERGAC